MFFSLIKFFKPAPAAPRAIPNEDVPQVYAHWRRRIFLSLFMGYGILYFCRKNISAVLPILGSQLKYSNTQLGILGSTLYLTYGFGKFCNGVLADQANIRTFMATSLLLSGVLNLWFGSLDALWAMALIWGLNGWIQSMGFPPIARALTIWYENRGRATRWAFWTTSHQAGTAAILALVGGILHTFPGNWRLGFYLPGVICSLVGIGLFFSLADTPESKGLPRTVAFINDAAEVEASSSYRQIFLGRVLRNRQLWVIAGVNLCVYIIRYGTLDWATKFLVETKGYSNAMAAGMASFMPFFGIAGVLVAGWVSDVIFRGSFRTINALMLLGLALSIYAFYASGTVANYTRDLTLLAAIGFFVEGPQSVLGGIASVDVGGSARIASAAAGLVGVCGYLGATLSSIGTGFFVDRYGWGGGFNFWIICAAIGFLLCLFAWRSSPLKVPVRER